MRTSVVPRLDSPLFTLVPDTHRRDYANVSNLLDVLYRGRETTVPVVVNTTLFQIMASMHVEVGSAVTMFLEEDARRLLFGIVVDDREVFDLWHYMMDDVPPRLLRQL